MSPDTLTQLSDRLNKHCQRIYNLKHGGYIWVTTSDSGQHPIPMDSNMNHGGKQTYPNKLNQLSDAGKWEQPAIMQLEKRRKYSGIRIDDNLAISYC